jgi:AcrR family transcriptional regulator
VRRGAAPKPAFTRLDHDTRRAQLVERGLRLFAKRPYDEVSMEDVAGELGISKGLLYHYFPTKRDLYVASLGEAARDLLERTDLPTGDPGTRLARGVDAYLAYCADHAPAYIALMRGGIGSDREVGRIVEKVRTTLITRILGGLALPAPPPRVRIALRGWIGMVEAATLDWVQHRDLPRDEVRDLLTEWLVRSLAGAELRPRPGHR